MLNSAPNLARSQMLSALLHGAEPQCPFCVSFVLGANLTKKLPRTHYRAPALSNTHPNATKRTIKMESNRGIKRNRGHAEQENAEESSNPPPRPAAPSLSVSTCTRTPHPELPRSQTKFCRGNFPRKLASLLFLLGQPKSAVPDTGKLNGDVF